MVADPKAVFLRNVKPILAAMGDQVQPCNAHVIDMAEHALVGELCPLPGIGFTRFDLDAMDWYCEKTANPEHLRMFVLRYHVLIYLSSAYRHTRDERYAKSARRYIEAFIRDHPTVEGWTPKPLDTATQYDIRVGNSECPGWLGTLHAFLDSPAFDDAFVNAIFDACRAHLIYLSGHIYPDRNIRLMHGEVLVINSARLSFFPEAAGWLAQGHRIVNDGVSRQILADGAHMEAVAGYHAGCMTLLTNLWRLARAMPQLGLNIPTDRIAGMYDYHAATCRPDGVILSMHDTRYDVPTVETPHPIAPAREAFRKEAGLPPIQPPACQVFPDAGQVFVRTDWSPDATYLSFDATTRRSYHWHPSRNSITLFAHRRALLIDTGYPFNTAEFPYYGHRTEHHSTVNLNGWTQSHAPATLRSRQARGYNLIEGLYAGGYWPLEKQFHGQGIFAEHHRTLLWIHDRCIVVLDHVNSSTEADRKPRVECVWQFSEGPLNLDPAARTATTGHDRGNLHMLFPVVPDGAVFTRHEGERDPMRGWLPTEWGHRCIPAPMIRVAAHKYDPWQSNFATVLVPFDKGPAPKVSVVSAAAPDTAFGGRVPGHLHLRWPDGSTDLIVWIRRMENAITQHHGLDTDASLAHLRFNAQGQLLSGLAVDGHYLTSDRVGGGDIIGKLQRC